MAAYNEANVIGRAIESILIQTFTDWELIIIDDGSEDDTAKVVRRYAVKDCRIRLVLNKTNLKLPASLNKGIGLAKADLIARADADDINLPERLERQFEFMQKHPEVDVLGTGAYLLDINGKRVNSVSLPQTHVELENLPFLKTHFFHPSVIMRREFLFNVGLYDETYVRGQDKELWLRGIKQGCIYANLSLPLIEYTTNILRWSWSVMFERIKSVYRMTRKHNIKNAGVLTILSGVNAIGIKLLELGANQPRSG